MLRPAPLLDRTETENLPTERANGGELPRAASAPAPTPHKSRPRRFVRGVSVVAAGAVAAVLVSAGANALLEQSERAQLSYGERLEVGDGALNVYRNGTTGPTVVMLTGYATASPVADFGPLIRELDDYQVVVVEGFGYGLSDLDASP